MRSLHGISFFGSKTRGYRKKTKTLWNNSSLDLDAGSTTSQNQQPTASSLSGFTAQELRLQTTG